jgi:hypothetical protein
LVVGTVVGAVSLVVLPIVMVLAVVMVAFVMAGRVVGAMLGDGGTGAPDGERKCHGNRCGDACDQFHSCLLTYEVRS